MNNPFAYSNYVTGKSFCNREKEMAELLKYIKGSQNVLFYSHRRYGKSSLIQQIFHKIKTEEPTIGVMFVELYGTMSEKDFITKTFRSLNQLESNFSRLLKFVSKSLKSVKLDVSVDPETGAASVSPSFQSVEEGGLLEKLMNILEKYSRKGKLVVAFDEFQEVAGYSEPGFEKRLRSFIQGHGDICYIFAGSQQHLLTEMFNSDKRAFYKLADSFPLGKIETKHYIPWIRDLFKGKNVSLSTEFIEEVVSRFENHPMYIQNFLFHLWDEAGREEFSTEIIDKIEDSILEKRSAEYIQRWDGLTTNQKKTLKLVLQNDGMNLYNADGLKSVNLKTGSLVGKALSSLLTKEIIVRNGKYIIQDIVFKRWLYKMLFL